MDSTTELSLQIEDSSNEFLFKIEDSKQEIKNIEGLSRNSFQNTEF